MKSYCINPRYLFNSQVSADVALLTLEEPLQFDEFIQPACWPYDMADIDMFSDDAQCAQLGIGLTGFKKVNQTFVAHDRELIQKMEIGPITCLKDD